MAHLSRDRQSHHDNQSTGEPQRDEGPAGEHWPRKDTRQTIALLLIPYLDCRDDFGSRYLRLGKTTYKTLVVSRYFDNVLICSLYRGLNHSPNYWTEPSSSSFKRGFLCMGQPLCLPTRMRTPISRVLALLVKQCSTLINPHWTI